jgi:hypothetical protein
MVINYEEIKMRIIKPFLAIGILALPAVSHAMETDFQKTNTGAVESKILTEQAPLKLSKNKYIKSSFKEINVSLLGPIRFTVEDNYVQRRFETFDTSRAQLVRNPKQPSNYQINDYYKSTIAKTGFKFKF